MGVELIIFLLLMILGHFASHRAEKSRQLKHISSYCFPPAIAQKVVKKYPHLTDQDVDMVLSGLREYFYVCHMAKNKQVAMPSLIVDKAWHEFILMTHSYHKFCQKSFGHYLHHTPDEVMPRLKDARSGIKTAWRISCFKHNIDPVNPKKLPLLFSIDKKLKIEKGFIYLLPDEYDDYPEQKKAYKASGIGCSSSCVGVSGTRFTSDFFNKVNESNDSSASSSGSDCAGGCGGD